MRPTVMCSITESWILANKNNSRLNTEEMSYLRRAENKIRWDRVCNETIRQQNKMKIIIG